MLNPADQLIAVIGGSGFIGRHIVRALAKRGYRIRVGCRRPELAGHLQPLGLPGQILAVQVNVRYPATLSAAMRGCDGVIYLPGVLATSGPQSFEAVHVFGATATARAAKSAGARSFVHMSSLSCNPNSPSEYARTKAAGEAAVRSIYPSAHILRPSIVFGPEDDFFNRFADMARFSPALPLIGGGETRFQPVFVGDVAEAALRVLEAQGKLGLTYELGGPDILSFRQLLEFTLHTTGRKRLLLPLPWGMATALGAVAGLMPGAPLTMDQVNSLKSDNVVSATAKAEGRDLAGLGIDELRSVQAIVPTYLYRYRKAGQFSPPEPDFTFKA